MSFSTKNINDFWNKLNKNSPPKFVKKVSVIDFEILKKNCREKKFFIKSIKECILVRHL